MFIFGKLGAPAMGVAGAAIGTLIARIFEFSVIDGFLWFREKSIEFRLKNFLCRWVSCGANTYESVYRY